MIAVTFQIITTSATHDADNPEALHLWGEIISIFNRSDITELPSNNRLGFGHILDVPVNDIYELSFLMTPYLDEADNIISRSIWRLDSSLVTEEELALIISENHLTTDWSRFKEVCKNVVTGLHLTDGDI